MKDLEETIKEQLKPYIISKYGKVYLNGEMRIEGLLLVIDSLLSQQRKEVLEVLDKQIAIHTELESQWTGITIGSPVKEKLNPNTERKEELLLIKSLINKL